MTISLYDNGDGSHPLRRTWLLSFSYLFLRDSSIFSPNVLNDSSDSEEMKECKFSSWSV